MQASAAPRAAVSKRAACAAFIGLGVSLALLILALTNGPPGDVSDAVRYLALLLTFFGATLACAIWGSFRRPHEPVDPLEVGVLFPILVGIELVIPGFFAILDPALQVVPRQPDPQWLVAGMSLVLAGTLAFGLGYAATARLLRRRSRTLSPTLVTSESNRRSQVHPSGLLLPAVYIGVLAARIVRIRTSGTSYGNDAPETLDFNQWSIYANEVGFLVIALTAIQVFSGRWPKFALVGILLAEVVYALVSGFLRPMLWTGLIVYAAARYTRWRHARLVVTLVPALAILAVPVLLNYRMLVATGYVDIRSLSSSLAALGPALDLGWGGEGLTTPTDLLYQKVIVRQASLMYAPAALVELTPAVYPYLGADELLAVPASFVPRALWPDKPVSSIGVWFGVNYLGSPPTTNSSAAISPFGELYLFAGVPAVLLGMAAYGVLLALLYWLLIVRQTNTASSMLTYGVYISLLLFVTDPEASFTGLFQGLGQRLLVFGLVAWVSSSAVTIPARRALRAFRAPGAELRSG